MSYSNLAFKKTLLGCAIASALLSIGAYANEVEKIKFINDEPYRFIKQVDKEGQVKTQIINPDGDAISERQIPEGKTELVSQSVRDWIYKTQRSGLTTATLPVNIALDLPEVDQDTPLEQGEGSVREGQFIGGQFNNQKVDEKTLHALSERAVKEQFERRQVIAKERQNQLLSWAKTYGLSDSKGFEESLLQNRSSLTVYATAKQLERLIESNDPYLVGIEAVEKPRDDINSAMADTNITNWALPFSTTRGDDIGIYMTESGCANESRITNYDRLSGSETDHSRNVGAIIRAVSPDSFLYCRGGAVLPQNSDLDGVGGNPPIYIITRSNSSNNTTSYNTVDRDWDNYAYDNLLAIFNSGGNTGAGTGNVQSPGKGLNLTTVANYNDANNTVSGTSPFVDPDTGNEKPELAAPGSNITAGGFTMSGTSMSTPHAAAFTADMMSSSTYLKYRPYLAKAKLLAGATDSIAGGYDKVGLGGIDFLSAQYSGYWSWWSGSNGSWNTFDGNGDGYVTRTVYISSSWNKARVVLAWMNRGTYTYNNRNNAHPIGMDLDLRVYDPNGNYVGGSFSWDDPFESVNFTPTVSGYYTFKINRYANRDTNSALRMGLYVNYYN